MHSLLLKIAGFLTGSAGSASLWPGLAVLLGCMLPLVLYQCSSSRLEDLRAEYAALEREYEKVQLELERAQTSLEQCRQDASLYDDVLTAHKQANIEIRQKYDRLREELMHGLLSMEIPVLEDNLHESAETRADAEGNAAVPDKAFQDWCAQPVPALLRGLLLSPADAAILP